MTGANRRLFAFGFGYSARALAAPQAHHGWEVAGTSREPKAGLRHFDRDHPLPRESLADVSHILVSIPPDAAGDPVLDVHGDDIAALPSLAWLGYLSTTGVYGDRGGGWVDETSELRPSGERGRRRVAAERGWLDLWRRHGVPVHLFRLAGIYGPGARSPFTAVRYGTARRLDKPGQVFSRIHVDDLAAVLRASIARPRPGAVYNVCDDEPAAQSDVVAFAAELLGVPPPLLAPFDTARPAMSPMARTFWDDNKRVSNALIKRELGVALRYPDYRAGFRAILAADG